MGLRIDEKIGQLYLNNMLTIGTIIFEYWTMNLLCNEFIDSYWCHNHQSVQWKIAHITSIYQDE